MIFPNLVLPLNRGKALQCQSNHCERGPCEGDLGEGEDVREEVGEHLVPVGLADQGEVEDDEVEDDAEYVIDAKVGNQTCEGAFESQVSAEKDCQ